MNQAERGIHKAPEKHPESDDELFLVSAVRESNGAKSKPQQTLNIRQYGNRSLSESTRV